MTLIIICIIVAIGYLCYSAWVAGGIPESMSATYYLLGKRGWLFQLAMSIVSLCLLPVWMDASSERNEHLVFLACSGLMFVAVAPAFRLKLEGAVHYSAAVVCCFCAILWSIYEDVWDTTLIFGFCAWMLYLQYGKWCWWLEIAVIGSVFANLLRFSFFV